MRPILAALSYRVLAIHQVVLGAYRWLCEHHLAALGASHASSVPGRPLWRCHRLSLATRRPSPCHPGRPRPPQGRVMVPADGADPLSIHLSQRGHKIK